MFTDVGGLPTAAPGRVRTGLLFRVPSGLAGAGELGELDALGLRLMVDLRGEGEDRAVVEEWAGSSGVSYLHRPISLATPRHAAEIARRSATTEEAQRHLSAIYRTMIDEHGPAIASTIGALSERLPAAYGCAAGKDRTGVVTALIHSLLGVPDRYLARHYANGAPAPERLRSLARRYYGLEETEQLPEGIDVMLGARQETILEALEHLRGEYGDTLAYLRAQGLRPEAADALREQLLT